MLGELSPLQLPAGSRNDVPLPIIVLLMAINSFENVLRPTYIRQY